MLGLTLGSFFKHLFVLPEHEGRQWRDEKARREFVVRKSIRTYSRREPAPSDSTPSIGPGTIGAGDLRSPAPRVTSESVHPRSTTSRPASRRRPACPSPVAPRRSW